ncbi:DUF3078 domain-containing protein [Dysgonomonas sp. 216]|uniref:DUF3078 domain-containing protein n=1 Tax=Dysgonomonas sp. 216 TaxID=2302934 RepID=UPI0013D236F4|nr:DUF3078 domain-containing protein [Dysgonomonas sp. 216]NDW19304.1 DUF3078 domain-containing protein [Dysgonomonas sp. 216]
MKRIITLMAIALFAVSGFAQDIDKKEVKPWELKGVAGLNFSQTSLSSWSAGGENSLAGNAYLNGSLTHKRGNWLWVNNLALEYGLTNTKSQGTQKSTDKIELSTQIGYSTDNKWYYTAMADFKSQFAKGYKYPDKDNYISRFMAPGYSNLSLGAEYRPNDNYSAYFSPIAGKLTFVTDDSLSNKGAFGVDPGDHFRAEMGAYLKLKAQKTLMENVTLISKADFFTAYDSSFGNVDVEWDVLINMKINKFLTASINTTLKYDDDVKYVDDEGNPKGPRVQFKEILGIGLAYNF